MFYNNKFLEISHSKFHHGLSSVVKNDRASTKYDYDKWYDDPEENTYTGNYINALGSIKISFSVFYHNNMDHTLINSHEGGYTYITDSTFYDNYLRNWCIEMSPYSMITHTCFYDNKIREGMIKSLGTVTSIQFSSFAKNIHHESHETLSKLFNNEASSYFHICNNISSNQIKASGYCLNTADTKGCFTMNRCTITDVANGKICIIEARSMIISESNFIGHKGWVDNGNKQLFNMLSPNAIIENSFFIDNNVENQLIYSDQGSNFNFFGCAFKTTKDNIVYRGTATFDDKCKFGFAGTDGINELNHYGTNYKDVPLCQVPGEVNYSGCGIGECPTYGCGNEYPPVIGYTTFATKPDFGKRTRTSFFSQTNAFTRSELYTHSIHFTFTYYFDETSSFSNSHSFSRSEILSNSEKFSLSNHFSMTDILSQSELFSRSDVMSSSEGYSESQVFSNSNPFSRTLDFESTDLLSGSDDFKVSSYFPISNAFSQSENHNPSNHFTQSFEYSRSTRFKQSKEFTRTHHYSESSIFTPSNELNFNATNYFSLSQLFSNSAQFTTSKRFSSSINFDLTNLFIESNQFSISPHFDSTNLFKQTKMFSKSNQHVNSIMFSLSQHFSKLLISSVTDLQNQIVITNNNQRKNNNLGIIIGAIAFVAIIMIIIVLVILLNKRNRPLSMIVSEDETVTNSSDFSSITILNSLNSNIEDPFYDDFQEEEAPCFPAVL